MTRPRSMMSSTDQDQATTDGSRWPPRPYRPSPGPALLVFAILLIVGVISAYHELDTLWRLLTGQ